MSPDTRRLVSGAVRTAATANAYRPFARSGPGAIPAWIAGWVSSELPLPRIAIEATMTATGLAIDGPPRTRRGRIGLGLSGVAWAGLVGLHVLAGRSGAVAEAAMEEAFGAGYGSRIDPSLVAPAARLSPLRLLLPGHGTRAAFTADRDIPYGDAGPQTTLDIWRRPDLRRDGRAPVLVQVHGGAWVGGNKDTQALPLLSWLAEHGWVCVVINYRLGPKASWPDPIVDVKRAIAWTRQHVADYGGDPGFIAISGGSAGGHLSSLAALTPNDPAFQPGFEDADTSVQAAAPLYGIYDMANTSGTNRPDMVGFLTRVLFKRTPAQDPEMWRQASPLYRVGPDAPPMFVLHGTNDSLAPVEQAREFVRAARAASHQPVAYAELPYAQHAYDLLGTVRSSAALQAVARFFALTLSEHRAAAPPR